MSATIEPTSATCQVRTSYLPDEILWGYEFPPVVSLSSSGKYVANFAFFDKVSKAKTMPIFKQSSSENGYQSNGCNIVSKASDPDKICLEQSYRELGEGKRRDSRHNVRISNVWTDSFIHSMARSFPFGVAVVLESIPAVVVREAGWDVNSSYCQRRKNFEKLGTHSHLGKIVKFGSFTSLKYLFLG